MLLIPDLLGYWLTGEPRSPSAPTPPRPGCSTSTAAAWDTELATSLGSPAGICSPPLGAPGEVIGPLLRDVARRDRDGPETLVTLVGSHDTASAVVGVPGRPTSRSPTSPAARGRWSASSSTRRS